MAGDVHATDVVELAVQLEATAKLVHGHVRTRLDEAAQLRRCRRRLIWRLGRLWLLFRLVGRLGFVHVFGPGARLGLGCPMTRYYRLGAANHVQLA